MIAARALIAVVLLALPTAAAVSWIGSAEAELAAIEASAAGETDPAGEVAVAAAANDEYCTPELKRILRRVLKSCGLLDAPESSSVRGCQPVDAKQVATMSGSDFNALFTPMQERGAIIQFEQGDDQLDPSDRTLIDDVFRRQAGASYFFIVARASPEGSVKRNRELSKGRAESLMTHLREQFEDPDLEREVGLLWLGEEFAQLETEFCDWRRSGETECTADEINRSAFVAWIDCRL